MITDVAGVQVGHWTDTEAQTGCTVVLFPEGTVASGEIRGGAPGTREWDLLAPGRLVSRIDAVVLAGGSAFGLAACDGVMRWCEEHDRGFATAAAKVPIVVGAVLYDLGVGSAKVRPGPQEGYSACVGASGGAVPVGRVGAGTGATVGKWRGPSARVPAGLATATTRHRGVVVSVLLAVNAYGEPDSDQQIPDDYPLPGSSLLEATSIGVVATNANLDKTACLLVAQSAHDGLARALEPVHTSFDGDALVTAAVGGQSAPVELVRLLAARVTAVAAASIHG